MDTPKNNSSSKQMPGNKSESQKFGQERTDRTDRNSDQRQNSENPNVKKSDEPKDNPLQVKKS